MANDLLEYSGWLQTAVTPATRKELDRLAAAAGLDLDIADGYIEFEYQGRDANRFVVSFLAQLAGVIGDADGEVRCDIETEGGDPIFEFYRMPSPSTDDAQSSLPPAVASSRDTSLSR